MSVIVVACFLIIFALLLFSIGFGLRFHEARRRGKLISMLRTVTADGEERQVNLLVDPDARRQKGRNDSDKPDIAQKLAALLREAGLDWTVQRFYIISGAAFLIGFVLILFGPTREPSLVRGLAGGAMVAFLPLMYVKKKRGKRLSELEAQLPDALDFLSRSMRAGHAFSISLEMVGEEIHEPLGQEFRSLFNEQNLGASLDRCLDNFCLRVPLPDTRFFSSAVLLQRQTGGNLSEILNRLSHIIRERFRLKGQVKAASAHGRMTAT
ncbi:MAG: type II secretion system F family protein, partial [Acidobacteriota bacterium]